MVAGTQFVIRLFYAWMFLLLGVPALASPQSALAAALADAEKLPYDVRAQARYLDASDFRADEILQAAKVLAFQTNQLSTNSEMVPLQRVQGDLFRIVLADYGWKAVTWEKLAEIDPWFHVQTVVVKYWPGGVWRDDGRYYAANSFTYKTRITDHGFWLDRRDINKLAYLTQSNVPLVNANWWFVQTARQVNLQNRQTGVGYYDWLGIKDRKTFLALADLDEAKSIKFGFDMRAALESSGVATQGRQVGRLKSFVGSSWFTLDNDANDERNNPIRNLARGDYKHKAEEWYLGLPNGLFAYFLGDDKGKRQDSAPDFIGADDSPLNTGKDRRIHISLSCIRCHVDGLRPVDDWVRRTLRNPAQLQADEYKKFIELARQYFSDLVGQLEEDKGVYAKALKKCNGYTPLENAKAYAGLWERYVERSYGTREFAEVLGVSEEKFIRSLKEYAKANYGKLDLLLVGLLAVPQTPLRIGHVEELVPLMHKIVRDYP